MRESNSQWAVVIAGQADESSGMFSQFLFLYCAFAFRRTQLHFCDQAAEILIPQAGRNEEGKTEFTTETPFDFAQGRLRHVGIF